MKEPGKLQAVRVISVTVLLLLMGVQQSPLAQRSGSVPYPPPKTNQASRPYTPPGGDSPGAGTAFDRSGGSGDPETRMLRRRVAAELADDFTQLRRLNREKVLPLSRAPSIDYKELSQVTGEITTRAKRIKANSPILLKEKKGDKPPSEADAARLGSMLPELARLIETFLGNPVFHTASTHDGELRSAAGRDLASIIRLSDTINRIAKRMAKASGQSV